MKNLYMTQLLVISLGLCGSSLQGFDPIVDFRTPQSLFEELHLGMNDVYVALESIFSSDADLSGALENAQNGLVGLSQRYDLLVNTTKNHQVCNNEDKEFLQTMIDRIDELLEQLEGSNEDKVDNREMIGSARMLCQSLRRRVS